MTNTAIKFEETFPARIFALEKTVRSLPFKFLIFLVWLWGISSLLLLLFSLGYIYYYKDLAAIYFPLDIDLTIGLSEIGLAVFLLYLSLRSFYCSKLLRFYRPIDQYKSDQNIFEYFTYDLARNFIEHRNFVQAVCRCSELNAFFYRLGINPATIDLSLAIDEKAVLQRGIEIAKSSGHQAIWAIDLFAAMIELDHGFAKVWRDLKLDAADLEILTKWLSKIVEDSRKPRFFNPDNLHLTGGFGRDWAYGYTRNLRLYSVDLTEAIEQSGLDLQIIGREAEIRQIEEALVKGSGSNAIIVGEHGVGKHTIVLGFAKKMLEGTGLAALVHHHVFQLDLQALIGSGQSADEVVAIASELFYEAAKAGNAIIFIENIDNLFSQNQIGQLDLRQVVIPYLDRPDVHLIGTCDAMAYNQIILTDMMLSQRFTRITADEPDQRSLLQIMLRVVPNLEHKTGTLISYEAVKQAVISGSRFILNQPNPEKSISLLEGAATKAASERGKTIILPKDIDLYISEKFAMPVGDADASEKERLLNLEAEMHRQVIGQDEALKAVANAMRRSRANIGASSKPIGSFLFLGPTGVGKTETAKALAAAYFGGEDKMIRFDMSEYQNQGDIYRLLGTEGSKGELIIKVAEKPFSLLLFDEIEKADPNILNIFLQILDEGFLTGGDGSKVSFANTIIIMTSNAGADLIKEAIADHVSYEKNKKVLLDYLISSNIYRPEFLNRFTEVVAFSALSLPEITSVASLKIDELKKSVLESKGIYLEIEPAALETLAKQGFDPEMGARPMERVIQNKIENLLADKILRGELKNGDSFTITLQNI
jgi:ATP-dependent Clp protease ATP-binding subunit ClpC